MAYGLVIDKDINNLLKLQTKLMKKIDAPPSSLKKLRKSGVVMRTNLLPPDNHSLVTTNQSQMPLSCYRVQFARRNYGNYSRTTPTLSIAPSVLLEVNYGRHQLSSYGN